MALTNSIVIEVMCGSHFDHTRTKVQIYVVVGNDWNITGT